MVEVDGYINNPYYANTIAFTAPFGGIVATANGGTGIATTPSSGQKS